MGILGRMFGRRPKDPYWDAFIHRPFADPRNNVTLAMLDAPDGNVYPVKADLVDPVAQSGYIREFAAYFGAVLTAIVPWDPAYLRSTASDRAADATQGDKEDPVEPLDRYSFAIVCAIPSSHDPGLAMGIGCQHSIQRGAILAFNLAAYIRELGYQATTCPGDSTAVAIAGGLGEMNQKGRFVTRAHDSRLFLTNLVLTDLPLAPDPHSS